MTTEERDRRNGKERKNEPNARHTAAPATELNRILFLQSQISHCDVRYRYRERAGKGVQQKCEERRDNEQPAERGMGEVKKRTDKIKESSINNEREW